MTSKKKSAVRKKARSKKAEKNNPDDKNWIQKAIKNPGALREKLGVKEGEKIPAKKLAKAAKSKSPTTRRQVALAKTLSKMRKKK